MPQRGHLLALSVCALLIGSGQIGAAQKPAPICPEPSGDPVRIVAVDDKLDLALADGGIAVLPGLDFGGVQEAAEAREVLTGWLVGRDALRADLVQKPDRWGRLGLRLWALDGPGAQDAGGSIAEAALAAGLARYRPDSAARPCRARLLAAEALARDAGAGVWRLRPVLDPTNRAAIAAAPPGLAVVEGKVLGLGDAIGRVYVNFGPIRGVDFAFTISRRNLTILETVGLEAVGLVGRHVRVRGLIDLRFGPQMEITNADAIELIDEPGKP